MILDLLFVLTGLGLLYAGAHLLVEGSTALSARLGLTPLLIGLTVVAFGTSSPELLVSLQAVLMDSGDLAAGNIIGSNICNIALIIGLGALIRPIGIQRKLFRFDLPVMILASLALVVMLWDHTMARWEGGLLLAAMMGYLVISTRVSGSLPLPDPLADSWDGPEPGAAARKTRTGHLPIVWQALRTAAGIALLVTGARLLVNGAVSISAAAGVSEALIGLTMVAFATSLPELATALVAVKRDHGDLVIGSVIGSNIFNILLVLGATASVHPLYVLDIESVDLLVMTGLGVLLVPIMWTGYRISRLEGLLLLAVYSGYLYHLWP